MLDQVKLALRYRNKLFDSEIQMYIEACKNNLKLAGIDEEKIVESDDSIVNAVTCYCKWQLNFQNNGAEWEKIYKDLKTSLALDTNYNVY